MVFYLRKAARDIRHNPYLHAVTMITVALSTFIVGAFGLFLVNVNEVMATWKGGIQMMAYLRQEAVDEEISVASRVLRDMPEVEEVVFIPRQKALEDLKEQLKEQASLLEDLKENPLPHAFEIRLRSSLTDDEALAALAGRIQAVSPVESVEYGRKWLERFAGVHRLFQLSGLAMVGLFVLAAVFIIGNTIRLVLYSKREEIEIMRLVGASDRFIAAPYFAEGIIQGSVGGILGIAALAAGFLTIGAGAVHGGFALGAVQLRFFPPSVLAGIVAACGAAGWLGSFFSLQQVLRR